jgi:NAD(P)-dependent dehydrogenase (short-subunit alcohol dehydrogenase family)
VPDAVIWAAVQKSGMAGYNPAMGIPMRLRWIQALRDVEKGHGRIHAVVTAPAVNIRKRLLDYTSADFDRVLRLNLAGGFHVLLAAGRHMLAKKGGSISFSLRCAL